MSDIANFFVYEAVAADGTVLYVGATINPTSRIVNHKSKAWWPKVARWTLTHCDTREQMDDLERLRIRETNPIGNTNLGGSRISRYHGEVPARILELLAGGPASTTELKGFVGSEFTGQALHQMYTAGTIKPVAWTKGAYRGGFMATWALIGSDLPEVMHPDGKMRWQRAPGDLSLARKVEAVNSLFGGAA